MQEMSPESSPPEKATPTLLPSDARLTDSLIVPASSGYLKSMHTPNGGMFINLPRDAHRFIGAIDIPHP